MHPDVGMEYQMEVDWLMGTKGRTIPANLSVRTIPKTMLCTGCWMRL